MKVLSIKEVTAEQNKAFSLRTLFKEEKGDSNVKVGTVTINPGERVPLTGVSNHEENEYSVIVKGTLLTEIDGNQCRVSSGQATFIPAGEEHIAFNDGSEECELVFVLVG
ncbi:cupin domain-containing protein [Pseudalkalibacillus decolorationis]|uniref:cupin domain-containing protein n=1 Tax=Pseudalkalibacillus decolorationis TaxID=163879 RepID=UPI00214927A2|nr:cupin domain-containing protein [Pseudalkalibacillus decolorationis]